jgi:enoyl-CoA hydratase/carnithine racemase
MGTLQRVSEEGVRPEDVAVTLASAPGDASFGPDLRNGQLTYLLAVPKPVIAAINGAVAGMALALVLACDIRLIADDAVIITAFAARGLVAEYGVSWLLPRLVGPAVALDLLFSSRRVSGLEAAQLGIVNRAVPREHLMEEARSVVTQLAQSCSPTSMSAIKRQVYQQMHLGLGEAEAEARELMAATLKSDDFAEGVRAFQEGRPPRFERIGDDEGVHEDG